MIDTRLNLTIGIRQAELINYEKIRKPARLGEPFADKCKFGWTIFGPDPYLKSKSMTRCNFLRLSDDVLEKKVDLLLHESFAEKPHDLNQAPSVEDKIVLNKYHESIKNIGNRFEIALPFKKKEVNLLNNHSYAMNRMIKFEQRFKKIKR